MAKYKTRKTGYKRNYKHYGQRRTFKKRSKYSKLEAFAYKMALVERGKKNPESKISESFNQGLKSAERKKKKMF